MPYPLSPPARILDAMKTIAIAAALHTSFGLDTPFKIRHERHRKTQKVERPAVALRLVDISLDPDRQQIHTQSEVCWQMTVDLVVDLALPAEASAEDDDATGWNALAATGNAFAMLFIAEDSPLRAMVDDVVPGDIDPDEDSKPDDGRLAQSIVVLYRTLWNDLNHLLSSEENGL